MSRPTIAILAYATQASTLRDCAQRRRVSDVRNPIKSIGPMRCTGRVIEVARSTSNSKTTNGIYVLKPKTHRPPRQPCCCKYSSGPPLAARGHPRNSGASAIQEAVLRGPLEVLKTRTCANRQRQTRRGPRAPCVQRDGRQRTCRADARAQSDPTAATSAAARAAKRAVGAPREMSARAASRRERARGRATRSSGERGAESALGDCPLNVRVRGAEHAEQVDGGAARVCKN
jgi:hypothetical protein